MTATVAVEFDARTFPIALAAVTDMVNRLECTLTRGHPNQKRLHDQFRTANDVLRQLTAAYTTLETPSD